MIFHSTKRHKAQMGFSLVEILVTAAITALVFGGLFVSIQLMIKLIHASKAEAGATSLAVEQIEHLRSLPYNAVGVVGGPVYGDLPATETVSLNGVEYTSRLVVRYEDDPKDGLGYGDDENGIIEDYKKIIVEYSWNERGEERLVSLSTNIVPEGVETGAGGGSLRIVVQDKNLNPVPNAAVTIINSSLATTTNTTQYTNVDGQLLLSGMPAGAGYMVSVTKPGYSSDYTVEPSAGNPNPFNRPLTIAEAAVTTKYFIIDQLSDLVVRTLSPSTPTTFRDDFDDATYITDLVNVAVSGGYVQLDGSPGAYPTSASFFSVPISGSPTNAWSSLTISSWDWSGTVRVRVYYDDGGVYRLIPDAMLTDNSSGFGGDQTIDLSGIDASVYDEIILGAEFTSDGLDTSLMKYWVVDYESGSQPITDVDVAIRGSKLLGDDPAAVYKYEATMTSDGNGEIDLNDIEWDVYNVFPSGYRLAELCPSAMLALDPNAELEASAILASTGVGLWVTVADALNMPISGAEIQLTHSGSGYSETLFSSNCGQAYFSDQNLVDGREYTASICASGYSCVEELIVVNDASELLVQMNVE